MDKSGQLTFSDDPFLNPTNEIYELLEKGSFKKALELLDKLMNLNPEYPGIIDSFRTAKFWQNRENEIKSLKNGKKTADFLMNQWSIFEDYVQNNKMSASIAYKSVMRYIFSSASEHYKTAFKNQEDTINSFDLLLNLGDCFLRLEDYKSAVETLEYARSSYSGNARLLSILGEAYYHLKDYPKSLLFFREAFFKNASEIDMKVLKAKPILDLTENVKKSIKQYKDIREWLPVFGFITDTFYVRQNLSKHRVDNIKRDVFRLENSYCEMSDEQKKNSNVLPRLINLYLWLLEYYRIQNFNEDHIDEIKKRLLVIDKDLLEDYLKSSG